jgi:hypothetical protein
MFDVQQLLFRIILQLLKQALELLVPVIRHLSSVICFLSSDLNQIPEGLFPGRF